MRISTRTIRFDTKLVIGHYFQIRVCVARIDGTISFVQIFIEFESIGWRIKSIVYAYLYILYMYVYVYTYGARLQRASEDDNA